jgi:hypothetical protein
MLILRASYYVLKTKQLNTAPGVKGMCIGWGNCRIRNNVNREYFRLQTIIVLVPYQDPTQGYMHVVVRPSVRPSVTNLRAVLHFWF